VPTIQSEHSWQGINNKLRMVARRAFGFHSAEALISMLFLTAGGLILAPSLLGIDYINVRRSGRSVSAPLIPSSANIYHSYGTQCRLTA